jgi:hypothetical protein
LHVQVSDKSLDIQFDPTIDRFVWYDDGSGHSRKKTR